MSSAESEVQTWTTHMQRQSRALERIADAVEELATSPASSAAVQGIEAALKTIASTLADPNAAVIRNAVNVASTRALDEHAKWKNARYQRVSELAGAALTTDGAHHKQWFLEQIFRALGLDPDVFDHPRGIAP